MSSGRPFGARSLLGAGSPPKLYDKARRWARTYPLLQAVRFHDCVRRPHLQCRSQHRQRRRGRQLRHAWQQKW